MTDQPLSHPKRLDRVMKGFDFIMVLTGWLIGALVVSALIIEFNPMDILRFL